VHLRRALLLFAIVLALAAIAASLSRERRDSKPESPSAPATSAPEAGARPEPALASRVRFAAGGRRERRTGTAGRPMEVLIASEEPGLVEIPGLGLSDAVNPDTPARFQVLREEPGRFRVTFTPADGDRTRRLGTLTFANR
jgi:hypothetical protein